MLLLWLACDCSLIAIWGALRFVPAWWAFLIGVPLLQVPAAWLSYHLVYGCNDDGNAP